MERYIGLYTNSADILVEFYNIVDYQREDDNHFIVFADVQISDQFYSWICGFRKKVKILSPEDISEDFKKFIKDIASRYEDE